MRDLLTAGLTALDLDPATPAQPLSAACGFVTAELAAGELSVTVQDTPEARAVMV